MIVIVAALMLGTLGVMLAGVLGMAFKPDARRSNKLMQWRIVLQASAILLFIVMMTLIRG